MARTRAGTETSDAEPYVPKQRQRKTPRPGQASGHGSAPGGQSNPGQQAGPAGGPAPGGQPNPGQQAGPEHGPAPEGQPNLGQQAGPGGERDPEGDGSADIGPVDWRRFPLTWTTLAFILGAFLIFNVIAETFPPAALVNLFTNSSSAIGLPTPLTPYLHDCPATDPTIAHLAMHVSSIHWHLSEAIARCPEFNEAHGILEKHFDQLLDMDMDLPFDWDPKNTLKEYAQDKGDDAGLVGGVKLQQHAFDVASVAIFEDLLTGQVQDSIRQLKEVPLTRWSTILRRLKLSPDQKVWFRKSLHSRFNSLQSELDGTQSRYGQTIESVGRYMEFRLRTLHSKADSVGQKLLEGYKSELRAARTPEGGFPHPKLRWLFGVFPSKWQPFAPSEDIQQIVAWPANAARSMGAMNDHLAQVTRDLDWLLTSRESFPFDFEHGEDAKRLSLDAFIEATEESARKLKQSVGAWERYKKAEDARRAEPFGV